MIRIVLGTAGHIDHGKTQLVRALTGVDTDRLKEEKERGITIDLGFAALADEDVQLGIVDVPGHEGFVRNMVAGATGMDVVLLVVAADEGVMPQTREHLDIVHLLGARRLVAALTKIDLVEEEWLDLVRDEVSELLKDVLGSDASHIPILATSAVTGEGLDQLAGALRRAAEEAREATPGAEGDVVRLPIDRVFTVRGTGTVVTGTLWSGVLETGSRIWIRPGEIEARIRGLQVHGSDVQVARAGERTAVALAGAGIERDSMERGQVLLRSEEWSETWMITANLSLLERTPWMIEQNQRVRLHAGTAEVMARVVLLDRERTPIRPGESSWVQLRLEAPVVARAGDRMIVRSYSPVTTIGGARVAEPLAPKRKTVDPATLTLLETISGRRPGRSHDGSGDAYERTSDLEAMRAAIALAGWSGAPEALLPVLTGLSRRDVQRTLPAVLEEGAVDASGSILDRELVSEAREAVLMEVEAFHRREPLRPGLPLEALRSSIDADAPAGFADRLLDELVTAGALEVVSHFARAAGYRPELTERQEENRDSIEETYRSAKLSPPSIDEVRSTLTGVETSEFWAIVALLEGTGTLVKIDEGIYLHTEPLAEAVDRVREALGGMEGLGPADFKQALPVTRKHLIPLLNYLDGLGITQRAAGGRAVPPRSDAPRPKGG